MCGKVATAVQECHTIRLRQHCELEAMRSERVLIAAKFMNSVVLYMG